MVKIFPLAHFLFLKLKVKLAKHLVWQFFLGILTLCVHSLAFTPSMEGYEHKATAAPL